MTDMLGGCSWASCDFHCWGPRNSLGGGGCHSEAWHEFVSSWQLIAAILIIFFHALRSIFLLLRMPILMSASLSAWWWPIHSLRLGPNTFSFVQLSPKSASLLQNCCFHPPLVFRIALYHSYLTTHNKLWTLQWGELWLLYLVSSVPSLGWWIEWWLPKRFAHILTFGTWDCDLVWKGRSFQMWLSWGSIKSQLLCSPFLFQRHFTLLWVTFTIRN